jgi:hypothetical protein
LSLLGLEGSNGNFLCCVAFVGEQVDWNDCKFDHFKMQWKSCLCRSFSLKCEKISNWKGWLVAAQLTMKLDGSHRGVGSVW